MERGYNQFAFKKYSFVSFFAASETPKIVSFFKVTEKLFSFHIDFDKLSARYRFQTRFKVIFRLKGNFNKVQHLF